MPIQHAIWQVGDTPSLLPVSKLVSEQALEDMILRDPRILSSEWMLIGRKEPPLRPARSAGDRTRPTSESFNEVGLFDNQNSACQRRRARGERRSSGGER